MKKLAHFFSVFFLVSSAIAGDHKMGSTEQLKYQIGQMLLIGFNGKTVNDKSFIVNDILHQRIGGVILFDYNFQTKTFDKNIESPEQVRKLNLNLQAYAKKAAKLHGQVFLPLIISVDYEGGKVNRLKEEKGFPRTLSAKAMAELSENAMIKESKKMAKTLSSLGFNMDFSPVLDVNTNPNNPIIAGLERSYSSDPQKVATYAGIFASQLKKQHILCSFKHFPGHGSSTSDSHKGFVDVSNTWDKLELQPYKILLRDPNRQCELVMTAHIINRKLDPSGFPGTLSKSILTGLLRKKLGFKGVIITDDMQMKAISEVYGLCEAVTQAINAGADMIIFGNQLVDKPQSAKELVDLIYNQVEMGKISKERIHESFQRIKRLKTKLLLSRTPIFKVERLYPLKKLELASFTG